MASCTSSQPLSSEPFPSYHPQPASTEVRPNQIKSGSQQRRGAARPAREATKRTERERGGRGRPTEGEGRRGGRRKEEGEDRDAAVGHSWTSGGSRCRHLHGVIRSSIVRDQRLNSVSLVHHLNESGQAESQNSLSKYQSISFEDVHVEEVRVILRPRWQAGILGWHHAAKTEANFRIASWERTEQSETQLMQWRRRKHAVIQ